MQIDPKNFSAEKQVTDLKPISKEILSQLSLTDLEDLKSKWWWLFSRSNEVPNGPDSAVTYSSAFFDVLNELGSNNNDDDQKIALGDLTMCKWGASNKYEARWKDKVVVSYQEKLFVPGAWMDVLKELYKVVLAKRATLITEADEAKKRVMVLMLTAD